jgi:hypothetical protein
MKLAVLLLAAVPAVAMTAAPLPYAAGSLADRTEVRAPEGALRVVVTDPIAHRPVRFAEVRIIPLTPARPMWTGFTNEQGIFDAGLLPTGPYLVEVRTFLDFASAKVEVLAKSRNVIHMEVISELDP